MSLHLNFLHEEARQKKQRQRDPLKLSVLGLLAIALLLTAYYIWRDRVVTAKANHLASLHAEWATREPLLKDTAAQEPELLRVVNAATGLIARIEGRFYWAPLLQELLTSIPREVQITRFNGRQQEDVRKVFITIDGIAAGEEPRAVADALRQSLGVNMGERFPGCSEPKFASLEDSTQTVVLDGRTLHTVRFQIGWSLPKQSEVKEAPAQRKKAVKLAQRDQ